MKINSPIIVGPISECSRSVEFNSAIPGSQIFLAIVVYDLASGENVTIYKGSTIANTSSGTVSIDPSQADFNEGDIVIVYQRNNDGESSWSPHVRVQKSVAKFHPPTSPPHLYECMTGFSLWGMRPGTRVDVVDENNKILSQATATDGSAYLDFLSVGGVPYAGTQLTAVQHICPKPHPPGGATEWVETSLLPYIGKMKNKDNKVYETGHEFEAPTITRGLYACSRSIYVENIIPNLGIYVTNGKWHIFQTNEGNETDSVALPAKLEEGEDVTIQHQLSEGCRWTSKVNKYIVDKQQILDKPEICKLPCKLDMIPAHNLKAEANIEIEVTLDKEGNISTETYKTVFTCIDKNKQFVKAPDNMPVGSKIRIRQGECDMWSEWSNTQVVLEESSSLLAPKIEDDLFDCQNYVTVSNLIPPAGYVYVISKEIGEISQSIPIADTDTTINIPVQLLNSGDYIYAEHKVCGLVKQSDEKEVHPHKSLDEVEIKDLIFSDYTTLIVHNVPVGAIVEVLKIFKGQGSGRSIASKIAKSKQHKEGLVDVEFTNLEPFVLGERVDLYISFCGNSRYIEGPWVIIHPPVLSKCMPNSYEISDTIPLTLKLVGKYFTNDSIVYWDNKKYFPSSLSSTSLMVTIPANASNSVGDYEIMVRNGGGWGSNALKVQAYRRPEQPAQPKPFIKAEKGLSEGSSNLSRLTISGHSFTKNSTATVYINNTADDSADKIESSINTEVRYNIPTDEFGYLSPDNPVYTLITSFPTPDNRVNVKIKVKDSSGVDSNIITWKEG